jgi:signal transduction histidine kinase
VNREHERLRMIGRWFSTARLLVVPLAVVRTAVADPPSGYGTWAWITCGAFGAGAVVLLALTWREQSTASRRRVAEVAIAFDTAIVFAFMFVFAYSSERATWTLFYLPVIEAALRFGTIGGIGTAVATAPLLAGVEWFRSDRFEPLGYDFDSVSVRVGLGLVIGAITGRLVDLLMTETRTAEARASEAERLRDALGRRADLLEAANRAARALSSSLELDEAFDAFIRELRGLVPFDRVALVLAENETAHVMAVAGRGADEVLPAGTRRQVTGSVLQQVLETNQTVYRGDMTDRRYEEEDEFIELGLKSRLVAPLLQGPRAIGMVSVVRREADAFSQDEVELLGLLGRLVGSAVQNIRAYQAERRTVEELRRLSALRADFVALVSHELRAPIASVIGSARTLQQRWRELKPDQRDSFLALIADETGRLSDLISDVLDTSRIESGTFGYSFTDVDIAELVRESVASAAAGQDEVTLRAKVDHALPRVRGDRDRLRQVLTNLIDNAVKYSPAGGEVEVRVYPDNSRVRIDVQDEGPGIAKTDQRLIFEKFGRVKAAQAGKPGTGLGLFIARSIAQAHGADLDVWSAPDRGAIFSLALPATK